VRRVQNDKQFCYFPCHNTSPARSSAIVRFYGAFRDGSALIKAPNWTILASKSNVVWRMSVTAAGAHLSFKYVIFALNAQH
jgi:hypothetical protein